MSWNASLYESEVHNLRSLGSECYPDDSSWDVWLRLTTRVVRIKHVSRVRGWKNVFRGGVDTYQPTLRTHAVYR